MRTAIGLTMADLAKRLGTSSGHISDKEHDRSGASGPLLLALEYVSGYSAEWIATGQGDMLISRASTITRAHAPDNSEQPAPDTARDVGMAWSVLESGTAEAISLRYNVHSFYKSSYGLEALVDQLGIDGLTPADKKEYLSSKGGGSHVHKWSGEVGQNGNDKPSGNGAPKRRRTKTS